MPMEFLFSCPNTGKTFSTDAFSIMDGHQVTTDDQGQKKFQATIRLHEPCPICKERHEYNADEMICPFTPKG